MYGSEEWARVSRQALPQPDFASGTGNSAYGDMRMVVRDTIVAARDRRMVIRDKEFAVRDTLHGRSVRGAGSNPC